MSALKAQVQDHCSFCDHFPVSPPSIDTIEHFRPKTVYPLEAYQWANLYYCCAYCQRKGSGFDEALLRPDGDDYAFEKYFYWDYTRGTIEINPAVSPEDRKRAEVTRKLYHLNEGHPSLRLREQRKRAKAPQYPIDDFAYRDFLESSSAACIAATPQE